MGLQRHVNGGEREKLPEFENEGDMKKEGKFWVSSKKFH